MPISKLLHEHGDDVSAMAALKGKIGWLEKTIGAENIHHPDVQGFEKLTPGSTEMKLKLKGLEDKVAAQKTFLGKPLQPGIHKGDGDFDYLAFKVSAEKGDPILGKMVAAKVQKKLYGV